MAYNTTVIKKDADNKPIPQYYNPVTDEYEVLQGTGGAARQVLYGPDGQPISIVDNKLAVKAAELEEKIEALNAKLDGVIDGTTPAKTQLTDGKVKNAFEIVPSDTTDLAHETIAIYVGFDGDLKVDLISGETITMYNLASGAWHPIQAKRVYATGTTATYILGAY